MSMPINCNPIKTISFGSVDKLVVLESSVLHQYIWPTFQPLDARSLSLFPSTIFPHADFSDRCLIYGAINLEFIKNKKIANSIVNF